MVVPSPWPTVAPGFLPATMDSRRVLACIADVQKLDSPTAIEPRRKLRFLLLPTTRGCDGIFCFDEEISEVDK